MRHQEERNRIFVVAGTDDDEAPKCPACGWRVSRLYVIAKNEEEARKLYEEEGIGMCGECLTEMIMEEKWEIVIPEK